jgi:hypothetical protein
VTDDITFFLAANDETAAKRAHHVQAVRSPV